MINAIIWHTQKNQFEPKEYSLPISQVFQIVGLDGSKNYDVIKDAIRNLTGTIIEWNLFGEDKTQEWGVCTFLATGKIARGRVSYRLNPEILDKIRHPVLFAKIQLLIQSQFKKRHTLVLYEFFIDFLSRQIVNKLVIEEVSLEKLYKLLGVDKTKFVEYGNFKFFNRDVLKPCLLEINKNSDIEVSYRPVRKLRVVVALTFIVERKASYQLLFKLVDEAHPKPVAYAPELTINAAVERLVDKGVSVRKAQELVATHDPEQIIANIEHVDEKQKAGKIKNIPAYLIKAVEEDYRSKLSPEESRKAEKFAARKAIEEAEKISEDIKVEWERFCSSRLREYFLKMSSEWQEQKRQQFIAKIKQEASKGNSVLYQRFQKDGFKSLIVERCFLSELKNELLTLPEETSMDEYIRYRKERAPA